MEHHIQTSFLTHEDRIRRLRFLDEKITGRTFDFFSALAVHNLQARDGQTNMALDVAEAMVNGHDVMIEAGVGIGKSFAYLVPAFFTTHTRSRPIVIATSSIQLSEQLYADACIVRQMLKMPNTDIILAKGMNNYLCPVRFAEASDLVFEEHRRQHADTPPKLIPALPDNAFWVRGATAKERSDFSFSVRNDLWASVCVDRCTFERCKSCRTCGYFQMRSALSDPKPMSILIMNQDLLIANFQKMYRSDNPFISPFTCAYVLDEVHNFEEKIRSSETRKLTQHGIGELLRAFQSRLRHDAPVRAHKMAGTARSLLAVLFAHAEALMKKEVEAEPHSVESGRFKLTLPPSIDMKEWSDCWRALDYYAAESTTMSEADIDHASEQFSELANLLHHLYERDRGLNLYWTTCEHRNRIAINYAPKNIADRTQDLFFSKTNASVILTSATITQPADTEEEAYQYHQDAIGFSGQLCERHVSPFDYDENSRLYIAEDLVQPVEDRTFFLEQAAMRIKEITNIVGGRTMVLFTANDDMLKTHSFLTELDLPYPILTQREGSVQNDVIEEFKANPSILLGTGIFWEGIDIRGDALSCVIIVRLPFPVPDPIIQYKCSQAENRLADVLVPEMITKLRQGAGRLIRSETDKGVLCILDARAGEQAKRPFQRTIIDSLPIKRRINTLEQLNQFVQSW